MKVFHEKISNGEEISETFSGECNVVIIHVDFQLSTPKTCIMLYSVTFIL